jgi:hypothetical protein
MTECCQMHGSRSRLRCWGGVVRSEGLRPRHSRADADIHLSMFLTMKAELGAIAAPARRWFSPR